MAMRSRRRFASCSFHAARYRTTMSLTLTTLFLLSSARSVASAPDEKRTPSAANAVAIRAFRLFMLFFIETFCAIRQGKLTSTRGCVLGRRESITHEVKIKTDPVWYGPLDMLEV